VVVIERIAKTLARGGHTPPQAQSVWDRVQRRAHPQPFRRAATPEEEQARLPKESIWDKPPSPELTAWQHARAGHLRARGLTDPARWRLRDAETAVDVATLAWATRESEQERDAALPAVLEAEARLADAWAHVARVERGIAAAKRAEDQAFAARERGWRDAEARQMPLVQALEVMDPREAR